MFWESMTDMENYHPPQQQQQTARSIFGKENIGACSPNSKFQDISMYENNSSPSRMSCDGSPNCSFTLRRPSMDILQDNSTQDSGYSPSEASKVSPSRRQLSFSSMAEDFFDLSEIENDTENQPQSQQTQLPGEFSKLITGSLELNTACSPKGLFGRRPPLRKALSLINNIHSPTGTGVARARSSLFVNANAANGSRNFKRPEPPGEMVSPLSKRSRLLEGRQMRHIEARSIYQRSISNQEEIKSAILRSSSDPDLIGDFSKGFTLPLITGRHQDLKSITPEVVAGVMRGNFDESVASFKIIDCRYPYEFDGGHIEGAQNIYTKQQIMDELLNNKNAERKLEDNKRHILIFHCEFSSERGPNLSRYLRNMDRRENNIYYPYLHFPEIYLLDGGYKNFFEAHAELCTPNGYLPMLHPDHEQNLKYFRSKSKTFNSDIKKSKSKHRI